MRAVPRAVPDSPSKLPVSLSSRPARFTAVHRLLRENGFDHVVRAESLSDRNFKVFFVHNSEKNARLGIILSKRILPGAVDRNRVKRTIREAFRQHGIKRCKLDLVVMVRRIDPQERSAQVGNLNMLFSRVENRCTE